MSLTGLGLIQIILGAGWMVWAVYHGSWGFTAGFGWGMVVAGGMVIADSWIDAYVFGGGDEDDA